MSIIDKLGKHYPNARFEDQFTNQDTTQFKWYRDPLTNETIGFPVKELSPKEFVLMDLMLEPTITRTSLKIANWNRYLFGDSSICPLPKDTGFRLVLFSFEGKQMLEETNDPLQFVFSADSTIVYQDALNGYVIEKQSENSLSIEELSSAAQALETDINSKIHFFVGSFQIPGTNTKETLLQEINWYTENKKQIMRYPVVTAQEILPFIFLNHLSDIEKRSLFSGIFDTFKKDPDLVKVIKIFIENLANVSSTAKQLYLHRNSLQYRLDKFSNQTSIDLKSFHGSFIAYLACMEWEQS